MEHPELYLGKIENGHVTVRPHRFAVTDGRVRPGDRIYTRVKLPNGYFYALPVGKARADDEDHKALKTLAEKSPNLVTLVPATLKAITDAEQKEIAARQKAQAAEKKS